LTVALESDLHDRVGGPYKGLDHYREVDWRLFSGRERECAVIDTNLRARRLTVLYGASGVGKSSLLRAGVVHHLRELARRNVEEVGVPEYLPIIVSDWRDDPLETLLRALHIAVGEFAPGVLEPSEQLGDAIQALARPVESRLLVVLDQLEEYFLYHGDEPDEEGRLRRELPRAVVQPHLRASFLFSIREDALAKLDRFKRDVPRLFETILRLEPLDRENAQKAIVEPLARFEGAGPKAAEKGLVEKLLDQLAAGAPVSEQAGQGMVERDRRPGSRTRIDPSYLQLVLARLWEREEDPDLLRVETLDRLDGAEAIARRHLDEALDTLPSNDRDAAAEALRFLVTPLGSKIALAAPELAAFAGRDLAPVLERLAGGGVRILRTVPPPPGQDGPTRYEIFHDVLGPAVLDWRARYIHAREQDELEERTRQERERLERENQQAQVREREERRRAQKFGGLALGALAALGLALAAVGFAWHQKRAAEHERRLAESRALAAEARGLFGARLDDALLLALKARDRGETVEARSTLLSAVQRTSGLVRFLRFSEPLSALAAGPGGTFVVGFDSGTLVLLDRSGRRVGGWKGEQARVESVAFNPRRPLLAVGFDQTVEVLGLRRNARGHLSLVKLSRVPVVQETIRSVAFSPDGRWLAAGGRGGVTLFQLDRTGRLSAIQLAGSRVTVTALAFGGPEPRLLAAAPKRGLLVWNLLHLRSRFRVVDPKPAYALALRPGGGAVAAAARGRVWFGSGRAPLRPLRGVGGAPSALAFESGGTLLASGAGDGSVVLWDGARGRVVGPPLRGQGRRIFSVAFDPGGTVLAAASADSTLALWDTRVRLRFGSDARRMRGNLADVAAGRGGVLAFLTTGRTLVIRRVDAAGQGRVAAHGAEQIAASTDGRWLAVASDGGVAAAPVTAHLVLDPLRPQISAQAVSVGRDGLVAAAVRLDPDVRRWGAAGQVLATLEPPPSLRRSTTWSTAISADGRLVAAGYFVPRRSGAVVLWQLANDGSPSAVVLRRRRQPVTDLVFDRMATVLASGDSGGMIELWRVGKRGRPTRITGHSGEISSLAFTPDGRTLASGGDDGAVRLWDTEEGRSLGDPFRVSGSVGAISFSPDGRSLFVVHGRRDEQRLGAVHGALTIWDATLWQSRKNALTLMRRRFCAAVASEVAASSDSCSRHR
jgi:WD40 repeat protein